MHYLAAAFQPSRYVKEPHLVVLLDGIPLDEFLAGTVGIPSLEGLVSTLDGCLTDEREREYVDLGILPHEDRSASAPLLVCPDDRDFACTVVVAEVESSGVEVTWKRLGVARGDRTAMCPDLGEIDWFEGVGPFVFALSDYRVFLARCRGLATEWWK